MPSEKQELFEDYIRFTVKGKPSDYDKLPLVGRDQDLISQMEGTDLTDLNQLNQFRLLAQDRQSQYSAYDSMRLDSTIAAALEIYADDATQYDEQGRIIWAVSDDAEIQKAANRLINILDLPHKAWKHIYEMCLYGDCYIKLYRMNTDEIKDDEYNSNYSIDNHIVNDQIPKNQAHQYVEYIEDIADPATVFELQTRGKTAAFIQVDKEAFHGLPEGTNNGQFAFQLKDVNLYKPDRFIHFMINDDITRTPETVSIEVENENDEVQTLTYNSVRGTSILQSVYGVQRYLQLMEDTLLLNRLTRSSLIRILQVEVGDMAKSEVNPYMRRIKQLVEQHISLDTTNGNYQSFQAPGPIENIIYVPVRNGKGAISMENIGGDVNVRDIADLDYFQNKEAGALKIPKAYLGLDMEDTGLSNGGSLTRLSARYCHTIKRIQTSYIKSVTTLLNLFFIDKGLDYVDKFQIKMTSPSSSEDLERNESIGNNIEIVSNIMDLISSLEEKTQKKILSYLVSNVMDMPEIAEIMDEEEPESEEEDEFGEDEDFDMGGGHGGPSMSHHSPMDLSSDFDNAFGGEEPSSPMGEPEGEAGGEAGGFTPDEFAEFEDQL